MGHGLVNTCSSRNRWQQAGLLREQRKRLGASSLNPVGAQDITLLKQHHEHVPRPCQGTRRLPDGAYHGEARELGSQV